MAKAAEITKAFAYLRTSSATNVGEDRDSHKRQIEASRACSTASVPCCRT